MRRLLGPAADIDPPVAAEWHWQQEVEHIDKHITLRNDRNLEATADPTPLD